MSEPTREERALRDALERASAEFAPQPLEIVDRPRRRWLPVAAAAAAVLVLGVGAAVVGIPRAGRTPEAATEDRAGWHWVSWHDVEVQVPDAWVWDGAPGRPDCIAADGTGAFAQDVPRTPYVALDGAGQVSVAIGCSPTGRDFPAAFGQLPFALWQPNLVLTTASDRQPLAEGDWRHDGWTLSVRRMSGDVWVKLLTAPGSDELAASILGSARTFETDVNGCASAAEVQQPRYLDPPTAEATTAPDSISICQYAVGHPESPGLMGSRRLTGEQARDLYDAIRAAPVGGGPDTPGNCIHELGESDSVIELLAHVSGEAVPMYVYFDSCFGNGIREGGVVRMLTLSNCRPIFAEFPIVTWSASGPVAAACGSPSAR